MDDAGVDLLQKMLSYNPSERPSAEECLNHEFLKGELDQSLLIKIIEEMKQRKMLNILKWLFNIYF